MKKTGRSMCISGMVDINTADYVYVSAATGQPNAIFKNIFQDMRKGYAYKVTYASLFPNVTSGSNTLLDLPFAIQTFSVRELRRFTRENGALNSGDFNGTAGGVLNTGASLAANNRTIGIVGGINSSSARYNHAPYSYQGDYVIKGDAMVTQSISLCVSAAYQSTSDTQTSYYIELEEYDITDNEEILLILNERSQTNSNAE